MLHVLGFDSLDLGRHKDIQYLNWGASHWDMWSLHLLGVFLKVIIIILWANPNSQSHELEY